jgi:hypothetical protein
MISRIVFVAFVALYIWAIIRLTSDKSRHYGP